MFQQASPSVVSIAIFKTTAGLETFEGVGTGFVWDSYGHIVTNYHCVSRMVLDRNSQVCKLQAARRCSAGPNTATDMEWPCC